MPTLRRSWRQSGVKPLPKRGISVLFWDSGEPLKLPRSPPPPLYISALLPRGGGPSQIFSAEFMRGAFIKHHPSSTV